MYPIVRFIVFVNMFCFLSLPAFATRKEGINGKVESVNREMIAVAGKEYKVQKQFRVIIVTFSGIHRYEKMGNISDIRIGDKVYAVVMYDEMTDIYLERY